MKKILLALLVLGLLAAGLCHATRRKPLALPDGDDLSVFKVEAAGTGTLISCSDPRTPLRTVRWVLPARPGTVIAQVATQNDRQQIEIFKDEKLMGSYLVPKPQGVRDGFFRLAELRDARMPADDLVVLLYAAQGTDELPLVVALDLAAKTVRWFHRASGERLALAEEAIYLFGARTSPVRLPLALASGEQMSPAGARSSSRSFELPPDVLNVGALVPTGPSTFLLAHKGGLSAYMGAQGWIHQPLPEGDPGLFPGSAPALVGDGKRVWWQPFPGRVIQVASDATAKASWSSGALPAAEPFTKDGALLHLIGIDKGGLLWFDLAVPKNPAPSSPPSDSAQKPEEPNAPAPPEDWAAYASRGLDRIYCWDPGKRQLRRLRGGAVSVPPGFQRPPDGSRLRPEADALVLENGSAAWLLRLSALPLGEPSATLKPDN